MRIIKAPLRISLFGGGTDLPEYYEKHGSTIISMAINRHIYLVHNGRPTGGYRLSYSNVEELSSLTTAKHTIIRQFAQDYGELEPCTLSIISDVPKGTGLGSSSALSVCAYELFRKDRDGHQSETAHAAYQVERKVSNCGVQDHLPASFGGFNVYTIGKDGKAKAEPAPTHLAETIDKYGLLLYTGLSRSADAILKTWKKSIGHLVAIQEMAQLEAEAWANGGNTSVDMIASSLHTAWRIKRDVGGVADDILNRQYKAARVYGALGGKLLGAGGGGCWFFLVPPESRQDVIDATGLIEIPFQIESRGVTDVYV
jgi:D-glycero-alpha-D-manno-heptose-7-phosphate kinase